jgi:hypothetical protein
VSTSSAGGRGYSVLSRAGPGCRLLGSPGTTRGRCPTALALPTAHPPTKPPRHCCSGRQPLWPRRRLPWQAPSGAGGGGTALVARAAHLACRGRPAGRLGAAAAAQRAGRHGEQGADQRATAHGGQGGWVGVGGWVWVGGCGLYGWVGWQADMGSKEHSSGNTVAV